MSETGILLPNRCRFTHGAGANVKRPFADIPLVMHEIYAGGDGPGFRGQFGFIPFTHEFRLPRHIHMSEASRLADRRLLPERILVLNGVALTELNGDVFVVAPGTLVDIPGGVPHTWTACPPGVRLPDGSASDGQFLMIYEYAEPTSFFPTASTKPIGEPGGYEAHEGDLEAIRFPKLAVAEIVERARLVWDKELRDDLAAG